MASKTTSKAKTTPAPASSGAPSGTVTVRPALRRNPNAPIYYSPVVDVRLTDRDLRLLSFVVPPADPSELVRSGDGFELPIQSQCELVVPPETVPQLIQALTLQWEAYRKRQG